MSGGPSGDLLNPTESDYYPIFLMKELTLGRGKLNKATKVIQIERSRARLLPEPIPFPSRGSLSHGRFPLSGKRSEKSRIRYMVAERAIRAEPELIDVGHLLSHVTPQPVPTT